MLGGVELETIYIRVSYAQISRTARDVKGALYVDNDDDGETAAGGRLAHLLQILVRSCWMQFAYKLNVLTLLVGRRECIGGGYTILWRNPLGARSIQAHKPGCTQCT